MGRPDGALRIAGRANAAPPWIKDATPPGRHQGPVGGGGHLAAA